MVLGCNSQQHLCRVMGQRSRGVSEPLLTVAMSHLYCVVARLMVACHTHETKMQPEVGKRAV